MVDYESAKAIAELSQEEVDVIARHEGMPEMAALELGNYLVQTPDGERKLKGMILDDIKAAKERGDTELSAKLKLVLKNFVETHPRAGKAA